jgi:uncharacterized membrane protein YqjE
MQADNDRATRQAENPSPGPAASRSVGALLADLANGMSTLVRQELRLAQAEGSEKMSRATGGLIAIVGGLLVAICALLVLLQALVIALANYMPASVASLIVGVVVALIAFIMVWQGRRSLSAERLAPKRTMRSLREDSQMMMEKTR